MTKNQKKTVDPLIIVVLGVVLVAVAFGLMIVQPNAQFLSFDAGSGVWGQLVVAFITGITTGGLSCLAVQGGLLASSLAHQIEQDYVDGSVHHKKGNTASRSSSAFPIFLFLIIL